MKFLIATLFWFSLIASSVAISSEIVHDSEFQLLQKQHGDKWAAEDQDIEKKLEALSLERVSGTGGRILSAIELRS